MSLTITIIFIIITLLVSIKGFNDPQFVGKFVNWPYKIKTNGEYYRMLSSGFLHADYVHLLINLFVLYQFGSIVENYYTELFPAMGRIYYMLLLLLGIIIPDIATYLSQRNNPGYRSLGASGAVSAVLLAYVLFNPWAKLYIYGILPIYSILAAILYIGYSIWADRKGGDNVNHLAHLTGAIFGLLFTIILKPSLFQDFIVKLVNFTL